MKRPSLNFNRTFREGFSLIELLVVIAIIAVLAGAGFTLGVTMMNRARTTTALATISSLETAVSQFHADYGVMPAEGLAGDDTRKTDNVGLLKVLLGKEDGTPALNTRAAKFLDVPQGKSKGNGGKDGLVYNSTGTELKGLYDPWGGVYSIKFDGDLDGQIDDVRTDADASGIRLNGKKCAIWSNGGTEKAADDVRNWQK